MHENPLQVEVFEQFTGFLVVKLLRELLEFVAGGQDVQGLGQDGQFIAEIVVILLQLLLDAGQLRKIVLHRLYLKLVIDDLDAGKQVVVAAAQPDHHRGKVNMHVAVQNVVELLVVALLQNPALENVAEVQTEVRAAVQQREVQVELLLLLYNGQHQREVQVDEDLPPVGVLAKLRDLVREDVGEQIAQVDVVKVVVLQHRVHHLVYLHVVLVSDRKPRRLHVQDYVAQRKLLEQFQQIHRNFEIQLLHCKRLFLN